MNDDFGVARYSAAVSERGLCDEKWPIGECVDRSSRHLIQSCCCPPNNHNAVVECRGGEEGRMTVLAVHSYTKYKSLPTRLRVNNMTRKR